MTFLFTNNESTTVGSTLGSGGVTLTVASGAGAGMPSPSAGQQFAVTLYKVATPSTLEIVYCTGRSGDNLTIVRAQEGTTARAWSVGDGVDLRLTAGQMAALQINARTLLLQDTTFYVDVNSGSNANDGLTSGTAWQTIQHAINTLLSSYDGGGNTATIQLANGTTYAPCTLDETFTGFEDVILLGNTSNSTLTSIPAAPGGNSIAVTGGILNVQFVEVGGGAIGIALGGTGSVYYQGVAFGACTVAHVGVNGRGFVNASGTGYVIGAAPVHIQKQAGQVFAGNYNVDFVNNVNFSTALLVANAPGTLFAGGITYTGASTGAYYAASFGGYIWTDGATPPSGFSAGSTGSSPNLGYFS